MKLWEADLDCVTCNTDVETEICNKTITATKASGYSVTHTISNCGKTVRMGQNYGNFPLILDELMNSLHCSSKHEGSV